MDGRVRSGHDAFEGARLSLLFVLVVGLLAGTISGIVGTGVSMIDEPVPSIPLMVPASRPTTRTKSRLKRAPSKLRHGRT